MWEESGADKCNPTLNVGLYKTFEEYQFPFMPKSLPSRCPEDHNALEIPIGKQLSPKCSSKALCNSAHRNSYSSGCLTEPEG
ncbi:hypothetical protein CEXT_463021 [Caerostris extrusa]|uniref:Uncharacterized protein n=1 Tax=Caerostris extrusa TaxID=172846 RepID=A0AAV4T5P3_CAEEX|nr:hypothetical protein CEXT_463021 [Caerostris extrusa]